MLWFRQILIFYLIFKYIKLSTLARVTNKISGGEVLEDRELSRYIVSVRFGDFFSYYGHRCGGTVLSTRVILTAAHCVYDNEDNIAKFVWIVSGILALEPLTEQAQVHSISDLIVHPNYTTSNWLSDLAMLKTYTRIVEDPHFTMRAQVMDENPSENLNCVTFGWGDTNMTFFLEARPSVSTKVLMFVTQKIFKRGVHCPLGNEIIFCAGDLENVIKAAQMGDSGSPLICDGKLTGVVSHALGAPHFRYFVNVYAFRNWILKNAELSISSQLKFSRTMFYLVIMLWQLQFFVF